jgi:DNA-binding IclR family transcriptional regulator
MSERHKESNPPSSVTGKLFAILDCFTSERQVLRLTDISALSGVPLSTVHRMCADLASRGALERGPDGTWSVGGRLWQIGSTARKIALLRDVAQPVMCDVHAKTLQSVHVAVVSGLQARYLMDVGGSVSAPVLPRLGSTFPLHTTASGKILLAFSDPEFQERVIAAGLPVRTPYAVSEPGRLRRCLAEVRRTQIAYVYEEFALGVSAVSAPIRHGNRVVAALTLVARSQMPLEKWEPLLRQGAALASRRLTAVAPPHSDDADLERTMV